MSVAARHGTLALAPVTKRSTEHRFLVVCALIGAAGLVVIGLLLEPDPRGYGTHEALGFRPCLPMELWNLPCPGCGVTTAVSHAVEGQWGRSFVVQPFGFLLFLASVGFIAFVFVSHARGIDLGPSWTSVNWKRWVLAAGLAMFLGWGYKWGVVQGWWTLG